MPVRAFVQYLTGMIKWSAQQVFFLTAMAAFMYITTGCASTNDPSRTCDCPDTTIIAGGQQRGIVGSPLTTIVAGVIQEHFPDLDTSYNQTFATPFERAGTPSSFIDIGQISIDTIRMNVVDNNGSLSYGGVFPFGTLPSDALTTYSVEGSGNVGPYSSEMFIGRPIDIRMNGASGSDLSDTLTLTSDLVFTWAPGARQPAIMALQVEFTTIANQTIVRYDLSGPDDGEARLAQSDLPDLTRGLLKMNVIAERGFTKCSCQPSMQYNLVSFSQEGIYRFVR